MIGESRSKKSIKNAFFNVANQIVAIVLQFVLRTVFIKTLAIQYLGVNGLFSNVLTMLSLTELGFGTAIICSLYAPLERHDENEIRRYFSVFKKVYAIIGGIILVAGLIVTPFIEYLVADAEDIPHLKLLFLLYLSDTVASYFYAQYRALFTADQKDYVNANNRTLFLVGQSIVQIIILFVFKNFILYLLIKIVSNILSGFVLSLRAKKAYPFIRQRSTERLSKQEKDTLIKDTMGVFTTRVELMVLNSTDNILLSGFLGSVITGMYSNYSLVVGTISTMVSLVFNAVQSSVGSYCTTADNKQMVQMYNNVSYVYYCIYGFCAICLAGLLTPFVRLWLGSDYTMDYIIVFIITFNFYLSCSRQSTLQFLTVNHLIKHLNVKNIVEACMNIGISIVLVKLMGTVGIFIGTAVSLILTSAWYEPLVLHKYLLKTGVGRYYLIFSLRTVGTVAAIIAVMWINSKVFSGSIMTFILCCLITALIAAASVIVPFLKTDGFKYLWNTVKKIVRDRKGKAVDNN